ncbi:MULTISPECIES: two-component regulator propeller domain-containing protein [unclassified Wenzhouxiangella]|uniref:two-component regulator propeller domain-containing protein n=1 Tax=unclassified Wenzhouxiangella TaxID=2613841 RepID=UPI000E328E57|nr:MULTISPECIES: two-component regulator propeller domain-containing protein [unclassified Wenzhouxiangella]RFF26977.1 hypothetical protein DZK25_10265 [Wenzhouxiangella sp. 15181]RFP69489.1 hypothetical protein DZK26_03755 [Wenzhouxiangella sp. 15190]
MHFQIDSRRPIRFACLVALGPRLLLTAALLALTGIIVAADDATELPPERTLAVESYGLDEGLAQSSVISLAEDSNGLLWFGTQEGLHRFDGHYFDVLRREPGDPESLVSSTMDVLTVDQHKRLWMGSNDAGVEVIDLADRSVSNLISRDGLIGLVRFDGR